MFLRKGSRALDTELEATFGTENNVSRGKPTWHDVTKTPVYLQQLHMDDIPDQQLLVDTVSVEMFHLLLQQDWLPLTVVLQSLSSLVPIVRLRRNQN